MDVNLRLFNQRVMGPDDSLYKRNSEQDVTEEDETPNNGEHTANKTVTASALDILSLQAQGAIRMVSSVYPEIAEVGYTEVTIDGVNAERLVTLCDLSGVIIAKGSACQSYVPTPSKTLIAIGLTPEQALNTVRITLDEFNTEQEIDEAAGIITSLVDRIRYDS